MIPSPQPPQCRQSAPSSIPTSTAVILLGGPHQQDNHFRPLSLDLPKPLFPVAGQAMLYHHVEACSRVPGLQEILLMGSYDEGLFRRFIDDVQSGKIGNNLGIHHSNPVNPGLTLRYLHESTALGTAGGLRTFASDIRAKNPDVVFVLHCDICCTFPLGDMLEFHLAHSGTTTLLGKRMSAKDISSQKYGCLVQDPDTREVLHWAEKPETFVSDVINCGLYVLNAEMLETISSTGDALVEARTKKLSRGSPRHQLPALAHLLSTTTMNDSTTSSHHYPPLGTTTTTTSVVDVLRLEQDILMPLAGSQSLYVFETQDFWCQMKTPGMALLCSEMYLERYRDITTNLLASFQCTIEGNVVIHPSASVHPSAKLGPNVAIGAGVTIGAGVRIMHAIILEGTSIHAHACVLYAIIGWNSVIGYWTRVEGTAPRHTLSTRARQGKQQDVTVFGVAVTVQPEIVVRNCIVLPHKTLSQSVHQEILL